MLLGWRAWFTGGRTFDSAAHDWRDLPESGVLIVVAYHDTGRTSYNGGDWYWLADGRFGYVSSGPWGTWQPKPLAGCLSCIKRGEGVPDRAWRAVLRLAAAAPPPGAG